MIPFDMTGAGAPRVARDYRLMAGDLDSGALNE
jgi:hypothetical protein